jgi:peptidoglycan/LPS O-acetylase OafA/YrhL
MWMGAIAGVLLFYKYNKIPIRFIPFSKPIRNAAILCSIIYISLVLTGVLGFYHIILSLFIAVVLIHISIESMSLRILNTKIIKHLGTISYGVYLLHMFPLFAGLRFTQYMESNNVVLLITVAIGVAICTYLLALISYRYFERPFLDYKNKFAVVKR